MSRRKRYAVPRAPRAPLVGQSPPEPEFYVAISIACMDTVEAGFSYDLAKLACYSGVHLVAPNIATIRIDQLSSSILASSRNDLAAEALRAGATHMLCIDSDMRFPKDALVRLLKHRKGIVGINYSTRKVPPGYVAFKTKGMRNEDHRKLATLPTSTGLEEVDAIGFGLVLIDLNVFRGLAYPAFEVRYDRDPKMWVGEDVDFCEKARANGHTIWVDHDLSKECAHIGRMEYRLEMIAATEDLDRGVITPEARDTDPVTSPLVLEA